MVSSIRLIGQIFPLTRLAFHLLDFEGSTNRGQKMWSIKPESTDEAFTGFASACAAAGPAGCAIATADSTADSIRQWTWDLIDVSITLSYHLGKADSDNIGRIRL